jgi:hypothetical protein
MLAYSFQIMLVLLSQLFLTASKTVHIKNIADNSILSAVVSSTTTQVMWLISSALGIGAVLEGDWIILTAYVLGGIIGVFTVLKYNNK